MPAFVFCIFWNRSCGVDPRERVFERTDVTALPPVVGVRCASGELYLLTAAAVRLGDGLRLACAARRMLLPAPLPALQSLLDEGVILLTGPERPLDQLLEEEVATMVDQKRRKSCRHELCMYFQLVDILPAFELIRACLLRFYSLD